MAMGQFFWYPNNIQSPDGEYEKLDIHICGPLQGGAP
jgi:hypothetical protein